MASTYFSLLAEFETGEIPLKDCCEKFFGFNIKKAAEHARHQRLPVPVYRGGSQKSEWLVSAADLANFIDNHRQQAKHDWERVNGKSA
ncbi:pyocin activator PrtN family protein [Aliamphritea hakodatensis]|uniref:pyocin activator PrtN family protein n=1 Tax=Aliamphritea hakodatensis TaxID=2895352 RepID=UPI0022FD4D8D|nr:pyocin activator PrtN family protein [Aliamphritea hakodatensis]